MQHVKTMLPSVSF